MMAMQLIFILASVGIAAGILAPPKTGVFVQPRNCHKDFRFQEKEMYATFPTSSIDECVSACHRDGYKCASISVKDLSTTPETFTCALNIGKTNRYWSGMEKTVGWFYYEKVYHAIGDNSRYVTDSCESGHIKDCETAWKAGMEMDKDLIVHLDLVDKPVIAQCHKVSDGHTVDHHAWLVVQNRESLQSLDMNRPREDYVNGFRNNASYWMGLENMYQYHQQYIGLKFRNSYWVKMMDNEEDGDLNDYFFYTKNGLQYSTYFRHGDDGKLRMNGYQACLCARANWPVDKRVGRCACDDPSGRFFRFDKDQRRVISESSTGGQDLCWRTPPPVNWGVQIHVEECNTEDADQQIYDDEKRAMKYRHEGLHSNGNWYHESYHAWQLNKAPDYRIYYMWGRYSGVGNMMGYINGRRFSTYDLDTDDCGNYNRALREQGGWWYQASAYSAETQANMNAQRLYTQWKLNGSYYVSQSRILFAPRQEGDVHT